MTWLRVKKRLFWLNSSHCDKLGMRLSSLKKNYPHMVLRKIKCKHFGPETDPFWDVIAFPWPVEEISTFNQKLINPSPRVDLQGSNKKSCCQTELTLIRLQQPHFYTMYNSPKYTRIIKSSFWWLNILNYF